MNTVLSHAWAVSHELTDSGQLAFFDESRSELVVVNALGGAVWDLVDGHRSLGEIVDILLEEAPEPPIRSVAESQVLEFVRSLLARQALRYDNK